MVGARVQRSIAFLALATAGALLLALGRPQETPPAPAPAPAPPTLEERVAALEQQIAAQHAEIERLARLTAGTTLGVQRLSAAAQAARDAGFEAAGPNPAARTALLAGFEELAAAVKEANAPPQPPGSSPAPEQR